MADYCSHYLCPRCDHRLFWQLSIDIASRCNDQLDLHCVMCARVILSWEIRPVTNEARLIYPPKKDAFRPPPSRNNPRPSHLPAPQAVVMREYDKVAS